MTVASLSARAPANPVVPATDNAMETFVTPI